MPITLVWDGPFTFNSGCGRSIIQSTEGESAGLYLWAVQTTAGLIPHYVGETGGSFARRHYEHFQAYASGVYSVRDADAFLRGEEVFLRRGLLWRKDAWRDTQAFIDNFAEFATHLARTLAAIQIFVAPLVADKRSRRRIETGLVEGLYALPQHMRSLFPHGWRLWRRTALEAPLAVSCDPQPPISGFPASFEA